MVAVCRNSSAIAVMPVCCIGRRTAAKTCGGASICRSAVGGEVFTAVVGVVVGREGGGEQANVVVDVMQFEQRHWARLRRVAEGHGVDSLLRISFD
jgi:hypothetical protein